MSRSMRTQNLKLALRADSGLAVGQFFPLTSHRNILGRSVEVEIPVDDGKVSRNHAAIDQQNGFYMIVDLGSTNGTYLNGSRLECSDFLNLGDEIRLGSTVFRVELMEKARMSVSKNWREPTSILLPPGTRMTKPTTKPPARPVAEAMMRLPVELDAEAPTFLGEAPVESTEGKPEVEVAPAMTPIHSTPVRETLSESAVEANLERDRHLFQAPRRGWKRLSTEQSAYGRWIALGVSLVLTAAAIAMRMS